MLVKIGVPATAASSVDADNIPCFTLWDMLEMLPKNMGVNQPLIITHDDQWRIVYGKTEVAHSHEFIDAIVAAIFSIRCIQSGNLRVYLKQPSEK